MVTKTPTPSTPTSSPPSHGGACAACRYQRRKCTYDCPLAPYFPSHQHQQFLNCHRFFGVHNMVKILRRIPAHQRATAVASLVYHADVRARDPVGGCHRIVRALQSKIDDAVAQLDFIRGLLHRVKAHTQAHTQAQFGLLPMTWSGFDGLMNDNDDLEMDVKPFLGDLCGSHLESQSQFAVSISEAIDLRRRTTPEENSKFKRKEDTDNSTLN